MKLAEHSVRKTNSAEGCGMPDGMEGGLNFCSVQEGFARIRKEVPIGTLFLVADEEGYPLLAPFSGAPRTFFLVSDGADALPLFSAPDGVTCICAAGGRELLQAARYFAEINRMPCYLFPIFAACDGLFNPYGKINAGDASGEFPLACGRIFCDVSALKGISSAYARILLSRLALFERRVLRTFCGMETGDMYDRAYAATLSAEESCDAETIVCVNALLRKSEEEGAPVGEGIMLARLLAQDGVKNSEWSAYLQLSGLYAAFLKRGVPRRYFVPDYALRAVQAGVGESGYLRAKIPTSREYAFRAIALEKMRALFLREINAILERRETHLHVFVRLGGKNEETTSFERLRFLPEYVPVGLSAVMRDFGLMEW